MREAAVLRRHVPRASEFVQLLENRNGALGSIGDRIYSDQGIAGPPGKSFHGGSDHAYRVIGRVVGLESDGESVSQTQGRIRMGHDPNLCCGHEQVHIGH